MSVGCWSGTRRKSILAEAVAGRTVFTPGPPVHLRLIHVHTLRFIFSSGSHRLPGFVRGSIASRSPSPAKLKARTASAIATPGAATTSGAVDTYSRAPLSIAPHSGVGG